MEEIYLRDVFLFGQRVQTDSQTILINSSLIVSSNVIIKIKEERITDDHYSKRKDCHQYFYYNSYYADRVKRSTIFSKMLQLKRICSEKNNPNVQIEVLKKQLKTEISRQSC